MNFTTTLVAYKPNTPKISAIQHKLPNPKHEPSKQTPQKKRTTKYPSPHRQSGIVSQKKINTRPVGLQVFLYGYGAMLANLIFNLIFLTKQP
jgi:hypothetical protein